MSTTTFEPALLPDEMKEDLCRSLLEEFGAEKISHRQSKGELTCCCPMPWHDEKRPSASLNYRKLVFNCFSCGSSGGLLWFIATCRGLPANQARDWIENTSGLGDGGDIETFLTMIDAIYNAGPTAREPIPKMSARVLDPWKVIHPYLTDIRHIPVQNVIDLQVGYAQDYQVSERQVSDRIIIPHFWKGNLTGWQSRRIWDDGTPKFLSTEGLPREESIYHYLPEEDQVVWVESPMSVLRHCHHLPIEATFGLAVTDAQVRLLACHPRVVLFPDPGNDGWATVEGRVVERGGRQKRVSEGLIERLDPLTEVLVVDNPWSADCGDMDEETVQSLVANAVPAAVWERPQQLQRWEAN